MMAIEYVYPLLIVYLFFHSLVFFLILWKMDLFQKERVIFSYHFFSSVFVTAIVLVTFLKHPTSVNLDTAVGLIILHGIYSLSFLELWALADDSYSLAILRRINIEGVAIDNSHLSDLYIIGERKLKLRLNSLDKLGLIQIKDGKATLSSIGKAVAVITNILLWMVNTKRQG